MGTDIHGVFQRKVFVTWIDIESAYDQRRNYQLFAVLADVRNGYGFAGCRTGEHVEPIARPRGLPHDFLCAEDVHPVSSIQHICPRRREWVKEGEPLHVWMGDHSHSWLTGTEMLAWKPPTVVKCGIVSRAAYDAWNRDGAPDRYCGGIAGPGVVVVDDNAKAMAEHPGWTHVSVEWESNLADELAYFFDEVKQLVAKHDEIRFVFGFDS